MNTAVVNVKVEPEIKEKAQAIAADLGFSLSSLVNAYLRNFVRVRTVHFEDISNEEPSEYLMDMLKESEEDVRMGRVLKFKDADEAIKYVDKLIARDEQ